jgi:hypothetical protein
MNLTEKSNWPSAWQRLLLGGLAGMNLWLSYTIWISEKHPLLAIPNGALTCVLLWFLALTWRKKSQ